MKKDSRRGASLLGLLGALILVVASGACFKAVAQWTPSPSADFYDHVIAGTMNNTLLADRLAFGRLAIDARLAETYRKQGRTRIRAGQATTRFVPVAASLVSEFAKRAETPEERQRLTVSFEQQLRAFQQQLAAFKLTPHDMADGLGLAFVLNFEVFSGGQQANAAQRAGISKDFRRTLLSDAFFQGLNDHDKQLLYEESAINTMAWLTDYRDGALENDAAKMAAAREASKGFLDRWWDEPVEGLELTAAGFSDRAAWRLKENSATTLFQSTSAPLMPHELAIKSGESRFRVGPSSEGTIEEQRRRFIAAEEKRFQWCLTYFAERERERGGTGNDLAFGQAVAVALNYEVYGGGYQLNDKQFAWVLREMRRDVMGSVDWQRLSDLEKQKSYEQLAIEAVETLHYERKLNPNPDAGDSHSRVALKRNAVEAARSRSLTNLKYLFSPREFENYQLTADGFAPSK